MVTTQINMFDDPEQKKNFGTDPKKLVRRGDPDTSVIAACSVDTASLEQAVFSIVKDFGRAGCIADQVLAKFPPTRSQSIHPRFSALIRKGLIEDTGERRSGNTGRPQRVIRAKK